MNAQELVTAEQWALATPPEKEKDLRVLAEYLSAGKPKSVWDKRVKFWVRNAAGDQYKARAIYRWIADRIAFEVKIPDRINLHEYKSPDGGYWSSAVGPDTTMTRRQTHCVGYALLYQALGHAAGLEVLYLEGEAGFDGENGEHAWNAVLIGDEWYMVDSCWGAGWGESGKFVKAYKPKWCLCPPQEFLKSHFPNRGCRGEPCYAFLKSYSKEKRSSLTRQWYPYE